MFQDEQNIRVRLFVNIDDTNNGIFEFLLEFSRTNHQNGILTLFYGN